MRARLHASGTNRTGDVPVQSLLFRTGCCKSLNSNISSIHLCFGMFLAVYWRLHYCTLLYCTVLYPTAPRGSRQTMWQVWQLWDLKLYFTVCYCTLLYCTTVIYCKSANLHASRVFYTVFHVIIRVYACTVDSTHVQC